jgi:Right handed beta helix region
MGSTTYGSSFNGQTISLKAYTGQVNISGSNITIKDCTLTNGGKDSIGFQITGANDTIDHCTITSPANQSMYEPVWVLAAASNVKVTRNDISRGSNLLTTYGAGVLIQNNYMHDTESASDPSDHPDAIEVYGGHDVDIKANRIVEGNLYDAPVNYAPYGSNTGNNLTIEDNFLDNGQSDVLVDNQNSQGKPLTNTRVLRNALGGHQNPDTGGSFGRYHPLLNEQSRTIVQDEAGLAANPSAIEWPSSGVNANYWEENSDLTPDKDGQVAIPN